MRVGGGGGERLTGSHRLSRQSPGNCVGYVCWASCANCRGIIEVD